MSGGVGADRSGGGGAGGMSIAVKYEKKLREFFKEKEKAAKRFKCMAGFLESATEEEEVQFLGQNRDVAFAVVQGRFGELETAPKKEVKKQLAEVMAVFKVLRLFLVHLPGLVRKRWQMGNMSRMIEKGLHRGNARLVRLAAFELLLLFIEGLGSGFQDQLALFQNAILLDVFVPEPLVPTSPGGHGLPSGGKKSGASSASQPASSDASGEALCRATEPATRKDALEMFQYFFDYITENPQYEFWFQCFVQYYFSVLYARFRSRPDATTPAPTVVEARFAQACPADVQVSFVARFLRWFERVEWLALLWRPDHVAVVMELHRSCMSLPMAHVESILALHHAFRRLLLSPASFVVSDRLELAALWRHLISNLCAVFRTASSPDEVGEHRRLCMEVLHTFGYLTVDLRALLPQDVLLHLHAEFLRAAQRMFAEASPSATDLLPAAFAESLTSALLLMWLRSPYATPALWADLRAVLSASTRWRAMLVQWKDKFLQVTVLLADSWLPAPAAAENASLPPSSTSSSSSPPSFSPTASMSGGSLSVGSMNSETLLKAAEEIVIPVDHRLGGLGWSAEQTQRIWTELFGLVGDAAVWAREDAVNVAVVAGGYLSALQYLQQAERRRSFYEPPWPLDTHFAPTLHGLCALGDKHVAAKVSALTGLCALYVRRASRWPAKEALAAALAVLAEALGSPHAAIAETVVVGLCPLYALGLPGATALLPAVFRALERLWNPKVALSPGTQEALLRIQLGSLALSETSYFSFSSSSESHSSPHEMESALSAMSAMSEEEYEGKMLLFTLRALAHPFLTQRSREAALRLTAVLAYVELTRPQPRRAVVQECVRALVGSLTHAEADVARAASHGLGLLAERLDALASVDLSAVHFCLDQLCENVRGLLQTPRKHEALAVAHLELLVAYLERVGALPVALAPALALKVFRVLEVALLGEELPMRRAPDADTSAAMVRGSDSAVMQIYAQLCASPSHRSEAVRDAAEAALLRLLNTFNMFPTPAGATVVTSRDEDLLLPPASLLFSFRSGSALLVLRELEPSPDSEATVRLLVRTPHGKYCWDMALQTDLLLSPTPPPANASTLEPNSSSDGSASLLSKTNESGFPVSSSMFQNLDPPPPQLASGDSLVEDAAERSEPENNKSSSTNPAHRLQNEGGYSRGRGQVPNSAQLDGYLVDALDEVLNYIKEEHSHLSRQSVLDRPLEASTAGMVQDVRRQEATDRARGRIHPAAASSAADPPLACPPGPRFRVHYARLLLAHLGLVGGEERRRSALQYLAPSGRLERSLQDLDRLPIRECFKTGLIYVGPQQQRQGDILRNEGGSALYRRFVEGLGWLVDLTLHPGYIGGLDNVALSSGRVAPYYATAQYEMVFHDVTLMPTRGTDHQQIHKKKHVGNDSVHIVWTENRRPYDPHTISSQFNEAHIVLHPLSNGFVAVQIFKKDVVPSFGPLEDGMVVPFRVIAPLARATAVNANLAIRYTLRENRSPWSQRASLLKEIHTRHSIDRSYEDYMTNLFYGLDLSTKME